MEAPADYVMAQRICNKNNIGFDNECESLSRRKGKGQIK